MNEKEFFMPGFEKDEGIEKWKEFHKQVNGENSKDYLKPVFEFSYNDNGQHAIARIDKYFNKTSKKIVAIVQSDNGMTIYTNDNLSKPNCIIEKYNKGAEVLFMEMSEDT